MLAGTHDSGMYKLSGILPAGLSKGQRILYKLALLPGVRWFTNRLTLTQTMTIQQQLDAGIRLFDLRVTMGEDGELYLSHMFLSVQKYKDVVALLSTYLDAVVYTKPDYYHESQQLNVPWQDIQIWPDVPDVDAIRDAILADKGLNKPCVVTWVSTNSIWSAIKTLLSGATLCSMGVKAQDKLDDGVLKALKKMDNVQGILFDNPTVKTVNRIINQ